MIEGCLVSGGGVEAQTGVDVFNHMPMAAIELDVSEFVKELKELRSKALPSPLAYLDHNNEVLERMFRGMRITRVNSKVIELFGAQSETDFISRFPEAVIDLSHPFVRSGVAAMIRGKRSIEGLYPARSFDGRDLWLNVKVCLDIHPDNPSRCVAFMADTTDQVLKDLQIQLFHEIDKALLGSTTLAKLGKTALQALHGLIPYTFATIRMRDERTPQYNLMAADGQEELLQLAPKSVNLIESLEELPKSVFVIEPGSSAANHESLRHYFDVGLMSVVIATLADKEQTIGIVFLASNQPNAFSEKHISLLRGIADDLAVGLHTFRLQTKTKQRAQDLEKRVKERTAQLHASNKELESFFYSISHELQSPLRAIEGYTAMVQEEANSLLAPEGKQNLQSIRNSTIRMSMLIEDLMKLAKYTRRTLHRRKVNLSDMVAQMCDALCHASPERNVKLSIEPGVAAYGDPHLLRALLNELVNNAWIYSTGQSSATIEFGQKRERGNRVFFIRDNGCGFDMSNAEQLFYPFHRLHRQDDYPGTGIGLATAERIVHRHGGRIWAKSAPEEGAAFFFTLSEQLES